MSFAIPSQQKVLVLPAKQAQFIVDTVPVLKPGHGEVTVRVEAAALNPVDSIIQQDGLFVTEYPIVLGWEAAGTVVELGQGVTNVAVGDKVLHPGHPGAFGTYRQYATVPADFTTKIPSNITIDQAAAIPVALNTAAFGLYAERAVHAGGAGLTPPWEANGRGNYHKQPIVVLGGSSSIGQYVIQLARLSGFSPIIVTASPKNTDYLKSLGATHVLDRNEPLSSLPAAVEAITKEPLRIVYASIPDADIQNAAYDLLSEDGAVVVVTTIAIDESKRIPRKHIADIFGSPYDPTKRAIGVELSKHIPAFFLSGELKPNHVEVVPNGLSGVPAGLERLGNNEVHALKLITHPQETP